MQALVGGNECAVANNPLTGLLKQQHGGEEWRQSYGAGPSGAAQGSSMRSFTGTPHGQMGAEEADRFFQQQKLAAGPGPMNMEGMRRELENGSRGGGGAFKGDREWASQYQPAGSSLSPADMARMEEQFRMQQQQGRPGDFASEFRQQGHFSTPSPGPSFAAPPPVASTSSGMYSRPGFAPSYGAYGGGMMGGMRSFGGIAQPQPSVQQDAKGKGRFVELDDADWEAQFARAGEALETKEVPIASSAQQSDQANVLGGEIDIDATESDHQLLKDLESTWASLKNQLLHLKPLTALVVLAQECAIAAPDTQHPFTHTLTQAPRPFAFRSPISSPPPSSSSLGNRNNWRNKGLTVVQINARSERSEHDGERRRPTRTTSLPLLPPTCKPSFYNTPPRLALQGV